MRRRSEISEAHEIKASLVACAVVATGSPAAGLEATPMITPTRADPVRMRPLESSTTVNMSSYASPGDRGAGYTLIRGGAGSPGATRNNSGSWRQPPMGRPKDVTCFGAKMDGGTGDTVAVQGNRRCRDVGASGQVTISGDRIPIGDVTLPSNIRLYGSGRTRRPSLQPSRLSISSLRQNH